MSHTPPRQSPSPCTNPSQGFRERLVARLAGFCMDRPWTVIIGSLVLTVLSAWAASNLDISTDLKRLIPETFPSVVRLDALIERAGNQSDIVVTIRSSDRDANIRYGERLAALLEKGQVDGESAVRFVQFHRDLSTLEKKALLYLSKPELEDIRTEVKQRIKRRVAQDLDLGLDDDDDEEDAEAASDDKPTDAGPKGAVEQELDDFEDDEDFAATEPVAPATAPGAVAATAGAGVREEMDDFEGDEDFGGRAAKAAPQGGNDAAEGDEDDLDDFEDDEDFETDEPAGAKSKSATAKADGDDEELDVEELKKKYGVQEIPEYYTDDEGTMLIVRARPFASTSDTKKCRQLVEMTRTAMEEARADDDPEGMTVTLAGHHLERTEEVKSIKGNMATSASVCLVLLLALIGIYFRRKRAILFIATPLVMSVLWSLGLAWVIYGFLNIISAFIFAVLLGLGIDFGIHVLARYSEARRDGDDARQGMVTALQTSGLSAATGAATTATVFFLLTIGDFQGFAQFGLVAGLGVGVSLLVVFTVMPALVVVFESRRPWQSRVPAKQTRTLRPPTARRALALAFTGLCVSVLAFSLGGVQAKDIEFEYAFNKLGSRTKQAADAERKRKRAEADANGQDMKNDPEAYKKVVGKHSGGAPTIVMTDDLGQTERLFRQFEAMTSLPLHVKLALDAAEKPEDIRRHPQLVQLLNTYAPTSDEYRAVVAALDDIDELLKTYPLERLRQMVMSLYEVVAVYRFVPDDQPEKSKIIADIRRRLIQKREAFDAEEREQVEELLTYLEPATITLDNLPEWLRVQFREPSGKEGRFLLLRTSGSKSDIQNTRKLKMAFFDVLDGQTAVPSAATYFVLPEIMETIAAEGPLLIGLALGGLLLILLLFFRSLGAVLMVLIPLVFSVVWTVGILASVGFKLNFYNVVVIPLLLGMGIDHGVHIYSRFVEQGRENLLTVVRETGSAIGVATLTTMIGFGGLFFADHVGLNTMGTLAVLGMALAFVAAVVTLPALLHLGRARR